MFKTSDGVEQPVLIDRTEAALFKKQERSDPAQSRICRTTSDVESVFYNRGVKWIRPIGLGNRSSVNRTRNETSTVDKVK